MVEQDGLRITFKVIQRTLEYEKNQQIYKDILEGFINKEG
jgi:hypothetical protein